MPEGDPMLGQTIGGWTLTEVLGSGGMGRVYRAVKGNQKAALKMVREALLIDPEFRRRFQREVDVMKRVRSGRMARVIDADPDAERPWLATELVDGPTLIDHIDQHGPLGGAKLLGFVEGLARAIDDLHQSEVVHRDIKPDNVMLTDWSPILVDFGIAKALGSNNLTMPGIAFGSAAWMSPEQVMAGPVGPPTDIWGWAATTAFAATGRRVFGGPGVNGDGLAARILLGKPNLAGVPHKLLGLLGEAFAKRPEERPSATDLVYRLSRIATDGKHAAPPRERRSRPSPEEPEAAVSPYVLPSPAFNAGLEQTTSGSQ